VIKGGQKKTKVACREIFSASPFLHLRFGLSKKQNGAMLSLQVQQQRCPQNKSAHLNFFTSAL